MYNYFIYGEKPQIILFRYDTILKELNRENLFDFLVNTSLKTSSDKLFYNSVLKSFYYDAYDFIITHFDKINCIQIYKDNAIRLWSIDRSSSKLFVFEDKDFCRDELTSTMLKELINFAENN